MQVKTITIVGDAQRELGELYSQGWRLVSAVGSWAVSVPIEHFNFAASQNIIKSGAQIFAYGVTYILEK